MSSYIATPERLEDLITITNISSRADIITARECQLVIEKCYVVVTTLVASTALPVLQILSGSTELGTVTLAADQADNTQKFFVVASGIAPVIRIPSGTTLGVKVKTAANGGAPAGVVRATLMLQWPEPTS